jgi:putative GTP pyrophosphokinase
MLDELIAEYGSRRGHFEALRDHVGATLAPLHADPEVNVHSISHRLKTAGSLRGKLARPDRTYKNLADITDLLGFRVVTYFDDGVEAAARFVEREFDVDLADSVDKRGTATVDRFGYRSLHYVCRPPPWLADAAPLRFEVQIRTILQHAWAEIEHDLGYKSAAAVPPAVRRRFSRLAGLLELADDEFLAIKSDLRRHREEVTARVRSGSVDVALDSDSLLAVLEEPAVAALDVQVAAYLHVETTAEPFYPDYLLAMLAEVGVARVHEVRQAVEAGPHLEGLLPAYFSFAREAFGLTRAKIGEVKRGYGLLFLAHRALARSHDLEVALVEEATRFFVGLDYPNAPDEGRRVAIEFVNMVRSPAGRAFRKS